MFELHDELQTKAFVALAKMIGQAELLLNEEYGKLTEKQREFIDEMHRNALILLGRWYWLNSTADEKNMQSLDNLAIFLHESSNPLACIAGYIELFKRVPDEVTQEQQQAVQVIGEFQERVRGYWNSLMAIFRENTGMHLEE